MADYAAAVDWPASVFWRELSEENPDAIVILSTRQDPQTWWASVDQTILQVARREPAPGWEDWHELFHRLLRDRWGLRMDDGWSDANAAMAAYDRHNQEVRSAIDPQRLVDWQPGDGWEPICDRLGVAVTDEPFPHTNTREEWTRDRGADSDASGG